MQPAPRPHTRRRAGAAALVAVLAVLAAAALAGCSKHGSAPTARRTWSEQLPAQPPAIDPRLPDPGQQPDPGPPESTPPPSGADKRDPNVVADHLKVPWGLAVLPSGDALVTERPTGRILQVQPTYAPAKPVMQIRGLDATGDGGLLGLALSPTYEEDGLLFAYVTTKTDNRVIRFSLGGTPKAIFTGIPKGRSDNGGRIGFGPDGYLYVGTGDVGKPALAARRTSLAGKILRLDIFGKPAPGNPGRSAVYATGFRNVTGLCWNPRGALFATDIGAGSDEIDAVKAGADYGWPVVMGPAKHPGSVDPVKAWATASASPGGCAVADAVMYVGQLAGKRVDAEVVPAKAGAAMTGREQSLLAKKYGRLRTVVAAPDGALWVTTSNRDGVGKPVAADDRVLRIMPSGGGTSLPL
jgi:glucose/arabinose dehydrogenase